MTAKAPPSPAAGSGGAAARAFAACRALLVGETSDQASATESIAAFEGYAIDDVLRMIGTKELG